MLTIFFKKLVSCEFPYFDSNSKKRVPSVTHLFRTHLCDKIIMSMYARSKLLGDPRPCYLGCLTTQSAEHLWGLLARLSHGDLTLEALSNAVSRCLSLRVGCAELGIDSVQDGRERVSGASLPAVPYIDISLVPTFGESLSAALQIYRFAMPEFEGELVFPPPIDALPFREFWPSIESFLDWLPQPVRTGQPASSIGTGMSSVRALGPVRSAMQFRQLRSDGVRTHMREASSLDPDDGGYLADADLAGD